MSLEAEFRGMVREEVRAAVRDELAPLLASLKVGSEPGEFLSVAKAAQVAGVSMAGIRKWIASGRLRAHRAGRLVRVRRPDLVAFLAQQVTTGDRPTIEEQVVSILGRPRRGGQ